MSAKHLIGLIAQNSNQCRVAVGDAQLQVALPDVFLRGFHDPAEALFADLERLFHLQAIGDIQGNAAEHGDAAVVFQNRKLGDQKKAVGSAEADALDAAVGQLCRS